MADWQPDSKVISGDTADVYFARTIEILKKEGLNPVATMEVFASRPGILCGIVEAKALLEKALPKDNCQVWALSDGQPIDRKEVALRITAPYQSYGLYETALCGMLSQPCLLYTSPSPRDQRGSRMPSSA